MPCRSISRPGASPRIAYSNPDWTTCSGWSGPNSIPINATRLLREVFTLLAEDAPAHFLWRHRMPWGVSKDIEYTPRPDARLEAWDIFVR